MINKLKILIIDDEQDVLDVLTDSLDDLDFEILPCISTKKAYENLSLYSSRVVGIVADYNIDEINGIEFRQSIREEFSNIPYMLISGDLTNDLAKEAMRNQICYVSNKLEIPSKLASLVQKYFKVRIETLNDEIEMSQSFVKETYPMLCEIEDLILELEEDPDNGNIYKKYCRLLHTIKGTSACVGLKVIADFTHIYEDYIVKISNNEIQVNEETISVLLRGYDKVKYLFDQTIQGDLLNNFNTEEEVKIFTEVRPSLSEQEGCQTLDSKPNKNISDKSQTKKKSLVTREDESINVQLSMLDEFLAISGELTVIRNYYVKALGVLSHRYPEDSEVHYLSENLDEMQKYSGMLQSKVTNLRKVSLVNTIKPLKRIVRDVSKDLGKKVQFDVSGEELYVDTSISKLLSNCLVHIIRNCVDHGIELIEDRLSGNKSETGNINLSIEEISEIVTVTIEDDGKGIDPEIIKNKAIEKELYTKEELEKMSKSRIFSIIFESGFSTAEVVSDISGRGVGMDMVKSSIEEFNGKINIESVVNQGTKFEFTIPLPKSVQIVKSLTIDCNNSPFSIAEDDIFEVISLKRENNNKKYMSLKGSAVISYYGSLIPYINLSSLLKKDLSDTYYSKKPYIVIVKIENIKIALGVDQIGEIEEVVVRKIAPMGDNMLYMGAALLGDRRISLIFQIKGFVDYLKNQNILPKDMGLDVTEETSTLSLNGMSQMIETHFMTFLLDDGQIYALPLKSVYRLEEIFYDRLETIQGNKILRYEGKAIKLIDLNDIFCNNSSKDRHELYKGQKVNFIAIKNQDNNQTFGLIINSFLEIKECTEKIEKDFKKNTLISGLTYMNEVYVKIIDYSKIIELNNPQTSLLLTKPAA